MVPNPVSGSAGRNRLSRRPFGPRVHAKDSENPPSDDEATLTSPQAPSIPWAYPSEASSETVVSDASSSGTLKARRPLPPRPRTYFDDVRRRPLPSASSPTKRAEPKDIPFVFSPRVSHSDATHSRDTIKDPFGAPEGVPSDSPIWKTYMDEAKRHDHSHVQNWNQNMDVILIFAGLFSAILTAFVVEFYRPLQPDLQAESITQLVAIKQLLEASLSGRNLSSVGLTALDDEPFRPQNATVIVNILWFISLTLSLGAAMGAMVIKQWLQFYLLGLSPNPYEFAHQHQYRYDALLAWHVPEIISALPFIMLASVGLFLTGLGLQLLQLNIGVAAAVITCMACVCLFYIASLVLSLLYPSCPYKTTAMQLWHAVSTSAAAMIRRILCLSVPRSKTVPPPTIDNLEVQEIRAKQPELAVNGLTWLMGCSQQEDTIQELLLSVSKFAYTDDMVQKLQAYNTVDQLVQRASVPLPPWGHEFWKDLLDLPTSHPLLLRADEATVYMKILMSIWHHPAYLALSRPHPVSERHTLDRKSKALELKATPDLSYSCLLGDWLLFWRLLKAVNNNQFIHLSERGYNLNTYVHIVCAEVCHYHLQKDVTPLYLPQNRGAFIDLHDLLQAVLDETQGELYLREESVCLLLDTMAYVFSGIENAPLELQGLPRTWFSPSQSPSLMRKETVLLLVRLLAKNRMQYNLVSKKLLLCLQMLLPVPMIAASRRAFFLKYQQESPSETELFEQMTMTLQGLIHVFVPLAYVQSQSAELNLDSHFPIASLALRQLVHSMISAEVPSHNHDFLFFQLPSVYVDDLLTYLASDPLFLRTTTATQMGWLLELLIKWHQHGTLSQPNLQSIVSVFVNVTGGSLPTSYEDEELDIPPRPDAELNILLRKTFQFLGKLWKNSDPFYGQLVSDALCDILHRSFDRVPDADAPRYDLVHRQLSNGNLSRFPGMRLRPRPRPPGILEQFIQMQAFGAIVEFLESEECTEEVKKGWVGVVKIWEEKSKGYTPSAQEVFQREGLKKAAAGHPSPRKEQRSQDTPDEV